MPENGIKKMPYEEILKLEEINKIAEEFVQLGVDKIRITGGEPLVKKGILNLIQNIASFKGIKDFAMTTNGTLLNKYAQDLKRAGLNRVNISLDTLNAKKYVDITKRGNLKDVLDGIEAAKKAGLTPIKINVVLIKGFNEDEIENFVNLTKYEEVHIRFIELMPIGSLKYWSLNNYISNETVLAEVKELQEVPSHDISSPARYYKLPGAKGRIGLISPISCKFCENCNRMRLTIDGKIKLCLHSNEEIDIKTPLRQGKDIKKLIENIIISKPMEHNLEDGVYISRNMTNIGG